MDSFTDAIAAVAYLVGAVVFGWATLTRSPDAIAAAIVVGAVLLIGTLTAKGVSHVDRN